MFRRYDVSVALPQTERLTREKWADAALLLLSREGIGAVSIERLSTDLGVTKGSAYHHFRSRDDLVQLALARWEHQATAAIIDELSSIASPVDRLRAILSASIGRDPDLGLEYLIISAPDVVAAPYIERVTIARVAFLEQIYRDFGLDERRAAIWGRSAYSSYLGVHLLRHSRPDDAIIAKVGAEYIEQLMIQLTPSA